MNYTDWSGVSHQYSKIKDGRCDIVFPTILELIAKALPGRILDFGAGDGRFALMCADASFAEIVAYEPAEDMCQLARANCSGTPNISVVQDVTSLERGSFELVVMNAVWMSLGTEEECLAVLGTLIACSAPKEL